MSSPPTASAVDPHHDHRWLILGVLGVAQLMVILDATIVNIALPSAQADVGFSDDNRQWVITAYALAFGSLLLLGGKIGDLIGRKHIFVIGLVGFAAASALGGAAGSFGVLVVARALQGVFGALLAPAALSLLTTTFTDPVERNKAFAIFGGIAGIGGGVGLLLGGVLTQYLSWRWCLYVNLAFAVPAALGALSLLHSGTLHADGRRPKFDVPGTVTITAGLFALVYGFSSSETNGWGDALTIGSLAASVVLIVAFVLIQRRVQHPLMPLRVVLDRNRGGSFLAFGVISAGMFGAFLFLTYYLQSTLGFSPVETGFAFVAQSFAIMLSIGACSNLLPRFGPRPLIAGGLALSAVAMAIFAQLETTSSYATGVLPGLLVLGLGVGGIFSAAMASATLGVDPQDAGVASAMVNTSQQVGGSIGTALLSTLSASAVTSFATDNADRLQGAQLALEASMHGYVTAFWIAAGILALGAVVTGLLLRPGAAPAPDPSAEPVLAH